MKQPGDLIGVTLTRAQWERITEVLGLSGNDAIAGTIAAATLTADADTFAMRMARQSDDAAEAKWVVFPCGTECISSESGLGA